jgi:S-adenosylmethionine uptake transporter
VHGLLLATIVLTIMHALVRYVGSDLHLFEVSFFHNLFGLIAVLPLVFRNGVKSLYTRHPGLQLSRSVLGVTAMLSWFYALTVVPIASHCFESYRRFFYIARRCIASG